MSHVVLLLRSTALWRGDVDAAAQSRWSGGVVSRTITARTVAVRDTILAVLRSEWPLPISTGDVLLGMAGTGGGCNRPLQTDGQCQLLSGSSCRAWCWYSPVYAQLRALSRLGLVEQVRRPDMRSAYWRYVPDDQSDTYFNNVIDGLEDVDCDEYDQY